jgi:hypothetical protein
MKTKITETQNCIEFRGTLGVVGKPETKLDLIEFISQSLELRCGRY